MFEILRVWDKIVFQHCLCDFRLLPVCDKGKSSPYTVISMNAAECLLYADCQNSLISKALSHFMFYCC